MSMLRTLIRRDQVTDIVHLHSAPTESDVMFAGELAEIASAHDGYQLRLRTTRTQGRLDLTQLDNEVPDWRERQAWACGPEGMLNGAERFWAAAGIADRLHLERFAASKAAPHGQGGTVQFARSGKTLTVDGATPLMDAGEQVGVQMPFGCRMGICQSCVVPPARRARPRPAQRRRTRAGEPSADMHFGCVRRLCAGHLGFTDR